MPATAAAAERSRVRTKPNPHLLPPELTGDATASPVEVRSARDYPRASVAWLWPHRIPFGKVTLLAGDPGQGKSLVALDITSRVTRGLPFPAAPLHPQSEIPLPQSPSPRSSESRTLNPADSAPGYLRTGSAPGSVLVLTNEDDVGDTIRPRLEAHGADLDRVFFAPKIADLRNDFAQLVAVLDCIPDCRLIIVDPVRAFVGASDSHFHTVVRRVLKPLADLAAARGIAVLAITHFRKNEGAAIHRAAGTTGFVGFARTVWTVCHDQRDPKRRILLPVKNNLGPIRDGLAYTIRSNTLFNAPVVEWESQPLDTKDIDEAVAKVSKPRGPDPEERQAASEWLRITLAEEPRNAGEVIREGREQGFGARTLRRGLKALDGQATYLGRYFGWQWSLPKPVAPAMTASENQAESATTNAAPDSPFPQSPPPSQPTPAPPPTPKPHSSADPVPANDTPAKKPVPLKETCPLTGNTQIPTRDDRPLPVLNGAERTPAAPPPDDSIEIDDDRLESSMQYLDACLARRRKPESAPPPAAKPPTAAGPHPLSGHPLIGQIAALAQRDHVQHADPALGATGSASACGGLPATGLRGGESIADQSCKKSGENWTRPGPACT